jgi:hypothetical protein
MMRRSVTACNPGRCAMIWAMEQKKDDDFVITTEEGEPITTEQGDPLTTEKPQPEKPQPEKKNDKSN